MCCSTAPARLTKTTLYGGEIVHLGKSRHVMGYQNTVQNFGLGPNAMILPIPALPGTMTSKNLISTSSCPDFMKDMAEAVRPRSRSANFSIDTLFGAKSASFQIFEHDIYTVVLADNARVVTEALTQVPADRRPIIADGLLAAYDDLYDEHYIMVCCFNNRDARKANPLLVVYEPMFPDTLFLPALDAHDGDAPNLKAEVDVDHAIVLGSNVMTHGEGVTVQWSGPLSPEVRALVTPRVIGSHLNGMMPNGDFIFSIEEVRNGMFNPKRMAPQSSRV